MKWIGVAALLASPPALAEPVEPVSVASVPSPTAAAPDGFVAPAEESSLEGPYGVLFVPRYGSLEQATALRDHDLALLASRRTGWSAAERARAERALRARLAAVRHWAEELGRRTLAQSPGSVAHRALVDVHHRLRLEQHTLELQLAMIGEGSEPVPTPAASPPAPPTPAPADRVVFGGTAVVAPGETVRDAIALGGDVRVRGRVDHDAVALAGDVILLPGGVVWGETIALGGRVIREGAAIPAGAPAVDRRAALLVADPPTARLPRPRVPTPWQHGVSLAVPFLALSGAGVLTVGLAPRRISEVARTLHAHPFRALIWGMATTVAALLTSLLFAITLVGLPVSLVLLAALGLVALLGFVGGCELVGDQLPLGGHPALGRWLMLAVGSFALAGLGWLPGWLQLVVVLIGVMGVGATVRSGLGRLRGTGP